MSALLAVVMQSRCVAQSIARTLEVVSDEPLDAMYMTYDERPSKDLMLHADLFIFDVFSQDALGPRASGVPMAERWAAAGRRVLLISSHAFASRLDCPYYWDVDAHDRLPERVFRLLTQPPPTAGDFVEVRRSFEAFIRPPYDGHHHR